MWYLQITNGAFVYTGSSFVGRGPTSGEVGGLSDRIMKQNMTELIFEVREDPECGFTARGLGAAIFTEADTMDALKTALRDAVRCHFDPGTGPKVLRLIIVREETIAA